MKKILYVILFLAVVSCGTEIEPKELRVRDFTIDIPTSWKFQEQQGYDSYVSLIETNDSEIISIDLGWYSDSLNVDNSTHTITYKTIDGKKAKIVAPINIESGTTGVYFGQIDDIGTKLQMSGEDLSKTNTLIFLQVIETIKFN